MKNNNKDSLKSVNNNIFGIKAKLWNFTNNRIKNTRLVFELRILEIMFSVAKRYGQS